ncbi:MAG TPA: type III-A CRISPR-associated RAMP protein Csm5 [Bacteroidales bacterium]|nr:type III-A CRISPR-associated RAMP protein Csm5 [Bacteroidales bacterium]HOK75729.1 type III-A CRISPR-associated RAMP protein Csm5 [Bacteroidales bacterium]HOM40509.1 type III-A CRISPR-associated RAMP protein Csm5 [Bacteroidales bacterium]HPP93641.1 type III-A CRISPR-associated RAMP protein Csm5 [Bacteroidales bacterium]
METRYLIKATVVTPVHVGAGQEKKLIYGVDFFYDNNEKKIIVIDQSKAYSMMPPTQKELYISYLADGKLNEFFNRFRNLREEIIRSSTVAVINSPSGDPNNNEILPMISSPGKNGRQVYIPGSSIKGALRSVIYARFYEKMKKHEHENYETNFFGRIDNNLMSFIHVSDAPVSNSRIIRTKIYNLRKEGYEIIAGWKNDRYNTSSEFMPAGFVTYLEAVPAGEEFEFSVKINRERINYLKSKRYNNLPKHLGFFENLTLKDLFSMINWHSKRYLIAEKEFFEHYNNGEDYSEDIIEEISRIINLIPSGNNKCLFHLGFGSGFHGITGNWKFPENHIDTGELKKGMPQYKSRRMFFKEERSSYSFMPLGFILLEAST